TAVAIVPAPAPQPSRSSRGGSMTTERAPPTASHRRSRAPPPRKPHTPPRRRGVYVSTQPFLTSTFQITRLVDCAISGADTIMGGLQRDSYQDSACGRDLCGRIRRRERECR